MNILILFPVLIATHTSVEVEEKKWILRWKEEIMWRFLHLFWPPLFGRSCKCWFKLNRWTCVGVPPSPFSVHRQHQQHLFGQDISLSTAEELVNLVIKRKHTKKWLSYLQPRMNACSAVWEVQQNIQSWDEGGKYAICKNENVVRHNSLKRYELVTTMNYILYGHTRFQKRLENIATSRLFVVWRKKKRI